MYCISIPGINSTTASTAPEIEGFTRKIKAQDRVTLVSYHSSITPHYIQDHLLELFDQEISRWLSDIHSQGFRYRQHVAPEFRQRLFQFYRARQIKKIS